MRGGKALASGSFGCVFKPSLATASSGREPGMVSKLMSKEDADEEYSKTQWLIPLMSSSIPNYAQYFILPSAPAVPLQLSAEDLNNFDEVCAPFLRRVPRVFRGGMKRAASRSLSPRPAPPPPAVDERVRGVLTSTNVNRNLSQLMVINQIDGGEALFDVFERGVTEMDLIAVLKGMATLVSGVEALSELGVMHMDVKLENVVFDGSSVRLIDWGLAARVSDYVTEDEGPGGLSERPFPIVCPLPPGSVVLPSALQRQVQRLALLTVPPSAEGVRLERYVYGDVLATYLVACKQYTDLGFVGNQVRTMAFWLELCVPYLPAAYQNRLNQMGERVKVLGAAIQDEGVRDALMEMNSLVAGVYFCQLREIVEVYVQLLPDNRLMMRRGGYIRDVFALNADLHGLLTCLYVLLLDTMQFTSGRGVESKVRGLAAFLMYKYLYSGLFATVAIEGVEVVADLRALARAARGHTVVVPTLDLSPSNGERLVARGSATQRELDVVAKDMLRALSASVVLRV